MNTPDKIIINTANLKKGGSLQVALSFIEEAGRRPQEFHILLGKASMPLVTGEMQEYPNCTFYNIDTVPTDSLRSLRKFRKELSRLEKEIVPRAVITVFGPCYWKPQAPHIMGFANGYLLYEDSPFFKIWSGHKSFAYRFKRLYHRHLLRREAGLYWIETEDAKQRLARLLNKSPSKIVVASNNCSSYFYQQPYPVFEGLPVKNKFRLVYIAALYTHKNFSFIPLVLEALLKRGIDVEVLITIKQEEYKNNTAYQHPNITNIGPVHPRYCPYLYAASDAVFMPSMLETFSAVYPEAMYMEKPLVTSDLSFAREVCSDAALYYHYDDADDAAGKIAALISNKALREQLIHNGLKRLSNFDSPSQRFDKILKMIFQSLKD